MSAQVTYNKATFNDFENIKSLMLQALESDTFAFSVSHEEYQLNSPEWWHRYIDPFLFGFSQEMFLAKDNEKPVGMVGIIYDHIPRKKHVATMVWFYVLPEYRNMKIGSVLLNKIEERIKATPAIKKLLLFVNEPQEKAIEIYKKYGFSESGRFKNELFINSNYYDVCIMEKFFNA